MNFTNATLCLVTPEWVQSVSACASNLQGCSCAAELWQETTLLARLMYKNSNQHRATRPFRKLQEVLRLLKLAQEADLNTAVQQVTDALSLATRPTLTIQERSVPTMQSLVSLLRRIKACCHLAEGIANATIAAASEFTTQLAQSFFMPLSLTCLAILARVRVLNAQMILDAVNAYNTAVEVAELLPDYVNNNNNSVGTATTTTAAVSLKSLPQILKCYWVNQGTPRIEPLAWSIDSSLGVGEGHNEPSAAEKLGLRIINRNTTSKISGHHVSQGRGEPMAVASLAVVEDRGMAISREQFRSELRQAVAGEPAMATAGPIDQAPLYNRAVMQHVAPLGSKPLGSKSNPRVKMGAARVIIEGIVEPSSAYRDGGDVIMEDAEAVLKPTAATTALLPPQPAAAARSALPVLPVRSTAFISVDGLASRKKKKKKPPPQVIAETTTALGGEGVTAVKSWEEWLPPIPSSKPLTGGGGSGSEKSKKKKRGR